MQNIDAVSYDINIICTRAVHMHIDKCIHSKRKSDSIRNFGYIYRDTDFHIIFTSPCLFPSETFSDSLQVLFYPNERVPSHRYLYSYYVQYSIL